MSCSGSAAITREGTVVASAVRTYRSLVEHPQGAEIRLCIQARSLVPKKLLIASHL